jgi:hypothetical protein
MSVLDTKIQIRKDNASRWESINPILSLGEMGFDSTNNVLKIGNGETNWVNLEPVNTQALISQITSLNTLITNLESEVDTNTIQINSLNTQVSNHTNQITTLNESVNITSIVGGTAAS